MSCTKLLDFYYAPYIYILLRERQKVLLVVLDVST